MWTFDNVPVERIEARHGFAPSQDWLDKVRLASLRITNGCSASFVSEKGLVMTNHHCARACVQQVSTADADFIENGFVAASGDEERVCPAMELNQLLAITDVTEEVNAATEGQEGEAFIDARKAALARLESECGTDPSIRCDVVSLYRGGLYHRYRYRRYTDVRLVFAPSDSIAAFGGDPDNFSFPRYDLDVAFLRAYDQGRPVRSRHFLRFSKTGAADGKLVFVSGHPGRTSRLWTTAQLAYARDYALPERLQVLTELRGLLSEFSRRSDAHARLAKNRLFFVQNAAKSSTGKRRALVDARFFGSLEEAEGALRAQLDPASEAARAFEAIAEVQETKKQLRHDFRFKEARAGFGSRLLGHAIRLVRWAEERTKPSSERLEEYAEARVPVLRARVTTKAPIYPDLEATLLGHYLVRMRAELGPDDALVREVLGGEAPFPLARRAVEETELIDPTRRTALFDGEPDAVRDSKDPMLVLARKIEDAGRAVRKRYEAEVTSVEQRGQQAIARARFDILGHDAYPDATFSLRLSYGQVKGFRKRGNAVLPVTRVAGLYRRATGHPPFALNARWREAQDWLDPDLPVNFVTNHDIVGGNSGSPVMDEKAEVVGIVFDGNLDSLRNDYGFDPRVSRSVAVDARFIRTALERVYRAKDLVKELR